MVNKKYIKDENEKIRSAYKHGYSRKQIAAIFGVSERKVITETKHCDRQAHAYANKEANTRLTNAVRGWAIDQYKKTGKMPTQKRIREKRKQFVAQRVLAAQSAYGEEPDYEAFDEGDTFRVYLELEEEEGI